MAVRVLVNDDEAAIVQALKTLLAREGYEVEATRSGEEALARLRAEPFNLLITDIVMRPMDGIALLREAKQLRPQLSVLTITGMGTVESAVDAMRYGAFDYISKPFRIADLVVVVRRALAFEAAEAGAAPLVKVHCQTLVGDTPPMRTLYRLIESLAPTTDTVLIQGEPGTEADAVALALHLGSRRPGPFLTVPCRLLPPVELEKALFGHSTGGTVVESAFHRARGGTLFLADVDAIPLPTQHRLLHFVRKVEVGADARHAFDVRLVLSASDQLEARVANQEFDRALHLALRPVTATLPPLAARREDLPILVQHVLNRVGAQRGRSLTMVPAAMRALEKYDWPGQTAELEQRVTAAAQATTGTLVRPEDLPEPLRELAAPGQTSSADGGARWQALRRFLQGKERDYMRYALQLSNGDRAAAGRLLALSQNQFARVLEQAGL
jgi:DNA-binding NtrC family response regulator